MNKLSTRALVLVSILLLMESVFVGSYFFFLMKAEEESVKQKQAKEIISTTNDLMNSLFIAGDNVSKSIFHPGEQSSAQYQTAYNDVSTKLEWLHQHVGDNPSQKELLDQIDAKTKVAMKMLGDTKRIAETQATVVAMQYGIRIRPKFQKHLEGLVQDFIRFLNSEKEIEKASPATMKAHRDYLRCLLIAALSANIVAAIFAALFFVRGITSRLSVVVENSERLLLRQNLHEPLDGNDELAQLDRAFHSMSSSLRGEEELIKASESQIRAMIDQMPLGLAILDSRNRIEYANPSLANMLGLEGSRLVGAAFSEHFAFAAKSVDTSDGAVEATALNSKGKELTVELSFVDVTLLRKLTKIAIVVDVTEKHAIEKMKQAFVAMVSHELRTPLTSVAGFLQLVPMGVYGIVQNEAVVQTKQAEIQVEQLITLINDLLDLEKLEAGKLQLAKARVLLEDIIDGALDAVYNQAELAEAELLFDGCETYLGCDSDRLRQALTKMLSCFLRMCGDTPRIRITADTSVPERVDIVLHCSKLALAPGQLNTLFEPFQPVTERVGGSLGLGFTLARAIANQHGGTCGADTAGGDGTRVWLRVPTTN